MGDHRVTWLRQGYYRGAVSIILEPRGPEPASVYWLRRGALILVVVTLIVGAWWLIAGRSAPEPAPLSVATPTEDAGAVVEEVITESTEPRECTDDAILVRAAVAKKSYPVGSKPKLTLTIKNTGPVPCTRDVGPKANELKITSGGYHVWSSKDCNPGKKSKVVTLEPKQRAQTSITWDGRLSKKGCPSKGAQAKPGSYELVGVNAGKNSKKRPFSLFKSAA
jgi:hypothetical protein